MKLRPLAAALACAHALILASLDAHASHADEGLEEKLGLMMHERFGFNSVALVRSRSALAAAIAENPFAADGEENFVHTLFLDGPVDPADFARLDTDRTGPERLAMGDRALHIDYCAGVGESAVSSSSALGRGSLRWPSIAVPRSSLTMRWSKNP